MKNKSIIIFDLILVFIIAGIYFYPHIEEKIAYNQEVKRLKNEVEENQKTFEDLLERIEQAPSLEEKYKLAIDAKSHARNRSTGYLSSDILENVFLEMAKLVDVPLADSFEPNSTLHVTSELYSYGGHSRVLERWIKNSPDNEKHSVFFTRHSYIPGQLIDVVQHKNGEIYKLEGDISEVERASELREIASHYERVILHIHMDDFIPLIAFGTENFKRPIFFFNHADLRFWLGVSIADCVISLSTHGFDIARDYRGSTNNRYLPLPIDKKNMDKPLQSKLELKEKLRLPKDKKIIFASGWHSKFDPFLQYNFSSFMEKVAKKRDDVFFLVIGPKQLKPDLPFNQFKLLGLVPYDEYKSYLATADLVIDSFPMTGATAMMDAIFMGIPILSLKAPSGQVDYIVRSKAYIPTMDKLISKTLQLLDNPQIGYDILSQVKPLLEEEIDIHNWLKLRNDIYSQYTSHTLHSFKPIKKTYNTFDELDFLLLNE